MADAPVPPRAIDLARCPDQGIRHVGVVFVHGIGSQQQGEILRDWGGAIAGVLTDFRLASQASGDPVLATQLDPTDDRRIFVELEVPAAGDAGHGPTASEQHWLLTEAWWAHEITPPSFGQMAQWLGPEGAVPRIVRTIIPRASGRSDPRGLPASPEPDGSPLPPAPRRGADRRAAGAANVARRAMADLRKAPMDHTRHWLVRAGAWAYLQAFSALLLLLYGVLRSVETLIPVGPLASGALTRPIDRFVLEWFGDVFVLLDVPAQAASVRGRLTDAIADLVAAGAEEIVVIAHSGGAIVTWTTLADPATGTLPVHSLVTIGEGLNLGWNITSGAGTGSEPADMLDRARRRFRLLYEPLMERRPKLRWVDYWGSRAPAPSGPIDPPIDDLRPPDDRFTSMPIWNRLSFREDHGGYWENDEEFVIPLMRRLEGTRGAGPSFFGDLAAHALRSLRRRRRISVLSLWKQLCLMVPTAAILTSFVAGTDLIPRLADAIAAAWAVVPGSQIVIEPLNAIRGLDLQEVGPIDTLAEVGVWVVASLIVVAAWFALISPPERGRPWDGATSPGARVIRLLIQHGPILAAAPLAVLAITAFARFAGGATPAGLAAVADAVPWIVAGVAVVAVVALVSQRWVVVRIAATAIILFLASLLVAAPFIAILIFPDVGRMVLGSIAIVVAFSVLGRIGTWRWTAWDRRERAASHDPAPAYRSVGLVAVQCVVFLVSLALFFVAVGFDLIPVGGLGIALVIVAILVGISIDVNQTPAGPTTVARTTFEGYATKRRL